MFMNYHIKYATSNYNDYLMYKSMTITQYSTCSLNTRDFQCKKLNFFKHRPESLLVKNSVYF